MEKTVTLYDNYIVVKKNTKHTLLSKTDCGEKYTPVGKRVHSTGEKGTRKKNHFYHLLHVQLAYQ